MKTALITGASGSIGSAIVKKFVLEGYFVIAVYNKDLQSIENIKKELKKDNLDDYIFAYSCDFSSGKNIDVMLKDLDKSFKHIDVLVNNAGIDVYALLTDTTDAEWDNLFAVNCKSAFKLCKWALPSMISRQNGKIINVSSVWGVSGGSMEVAYSSTKSALIGFTKALSKEVAINGVTVNCVCPGVIDSKMNQRFSNEEIDELINQIPMGRLGRPQEIADLIYFLSSEKASYVTGQIITADGGFIV